MSTIILSSFTGMVQAVGSCDVTSASMYTCTGQINSLQTLIGTALEVTTAEDFGIETDVGNAFTLTGYDGLRFIDENNSTITGANNGIYSANYDSGTLTITTSGTVTGTNGNGIAAYNNGSEALSITTSGTVTGTNGSGITAYNNGSGALSITTSGTVTGTNENGISAENTGTDLTIEATDDVFGSFNGIYANNNGSGALSITTTGTVTGTNENGIYARNDGAGGGLTIKVHNVSSDTSGIFAANNGSELTITTTGMVTGTNEYGINARNDGTGVTSLTVNSGSTVEGGTVGIYVTAGTPVDITNFGIIRNVSNLSSDSAIQTIGGQGSLINNGLLQGSVQLSNSGNRFINNAGSTWDTADGTNNFGSNVTDNSLLNKGTLIAANGSATDSVQTTTFDDVGTFTNIGLLSLDNGRAGDITVINGDYVGDGGSLLLNTVLASDASLTDKLVVNGDTSGTTHVSVNNLGGRGAATLNGIELIEVNGKSDGEFVKKGRIVAGIYEYSLVRGLEANINNWYLTSAVNPDPKPDPQHSVERPEVGAYTANLAAANTLFVTRLHDRLGETQYTDVLTGEQKVTSLWLRNEGGHNRFRDDHGQLSTQANRYVVQLGSDIAQWSHNGVNRFHLGLMAGYGNSKSTTVSSLSGYNAKGAVDGYSSGVYGTWYANEVDKSGLYVDSWVQYSWFNNTVTGQALASEEYKSKGVTASVESGYTFNVGENAAKNATYFIQPKIQVTWMGVKADDHTEANGTRVSGEGNDNIQTRLGVKAFMNGYSDQDKGKDRVFQPFVEANWIHNTQDVGTTMDGVSEQQAGAANIAELKVGVEGQLNKQVNLWGNIGQQVGSTGYSDTAVMLGVKYNF